MTDADHRTFQVLTKRPEHALSIADDIEWPENVWLGVSIENTRFTFRADVLRQIPAAVRFISAEPLLVSLFENGGPNRARLNLDRIDWLIVGDESGRGHRPMNLEWAHELREASSAAGTSFFFKQKAGPRPGMERELDGRTWEEFPRVHRASSDVPGRAA